MNTQVQRAEHFIVLTLNHNTVSLQELPKYTLTCNQVEEFLREFSQDPQVEEIVGLCTCNRIEFYAMVHSVKDASHQLARRIGEKAGCAFDQLMNKMDVCVDGDAMRHLVRLVCGLDSMVIGDAQILGQVKAAFQQSVELGTVGKSFHAVFQKAFSIAKRVRKETGLGKGRVSVSALAVERARNYFGSMHHVVAAVVGAGKMGSLAAKYLADAGVKEIRIVNRSLERSLEVAEKINGKVYSLDEMNRVLTEADLIISGTAAEEFIITAAQTREAQAQHPHKQLLIDIALPPDIDPDVKQIEHITLVNMEELRQEARSNMAERNEQLQKAETIVENELDAIGNLTMQFHIDAFANRLGTYADQICQEEIQRLFEALPDLNAHQREIIETQMVRLSQRIILAPRRNIRKQNRVRKCPDAFQCLVDLFSADCGSRSTARTDITEKETHA
jgi:glutamyl-tRNA reductase